MNVLDRAYAGYERGVSYARRRSRRFDHLWLALERYNDVLGGRLAAAISYYAFFAAFSLAVVGYGILGYFLETDAGLMRTVNSYLADNLSWVTSAANVTGRGTFTVVGGVSLLLAGLGWVDALRSAQRAVWHLDQHPGNPVLRRLIDLGALVGLGLLLGLSLAIAWVVELVLVMVIGDEITVVGRTVLAWSGPALELVVNLVLATAVLVAVPRLRVPARRLAPALILLAGGIQLLNWLGRVLIARTQHSPQYSVVTGAVGLLVYLYLLNQLIIFAAALVATGRHGEVVDLSAPREQQVEAALVAVAELHAAVEAVRLAGEKAREVIEAGSADGPASDSSARNGGGAPGSATAEESPDPDEVSPRRGGSPGEPPGGSGAPAGGPAGKAS